MSKEQRSADVILKNGAIIVDGKPLKYERIQSFVVRNKQSKRYAIYLCLGGGGCIKIRPIRKSGKLSVSKEHWTHEGNWFFVGSIDHCIAYRERKLPINPIFRFLTRLFTDEAEPLYEWAENIKFWPEDRHANVFHWHMVMERESKRNA